LDFWGGAVFETELPRFNGRVAPLFAELRQKCK